MFTGLQGLVAKGLLLIIPSLGGPVASLLAAVAIQLADAEARIMMPIITRLIMEAEDKNKHPELDQGWEKFAWVFKETVILFPEANARAIGTMINMVVQKVKT